jgi:3-hydroxybutyryl-CoA dehydrogenase
MKNITVIGSGTMGNGIAHVFAQFGYSVNLVDISEPALQKALATISKNIDRQVAKGTISEADKAATLANIKTFTKVEEGAKNADLVVEAASENVNIKLAIFKQLDEICPPHTILASNTSSISITQIAAVTKRPDKIIGMHFMNPVPVMKLIEVIRGYSTSDEVCNLIMETSKKLNKVPT